MGEVVGSNCGAVVKKNLVVFTSGPLETLAKFLSDLVEMAEKTNEGLFACFVWQVSRQY